MKGFISAATLALVGIASASPVPGPTSTPVQLKISAPKSKFDGKFLSACHSGAATESLCVGDSPTTFKFNVTAGATSPLEGYNPPGTLAFTLPVSGVPGGNISEPLSLAFDPSTNVAGATFTPGYTSQTLTTSIHGDVGIISYLHKGDSKPSDKAQFLNNWYVCTTYYGYEAQTVNWVVGDSAPFNPTCEKVTIKKV